MASLLTLDRGSIVETAYHQSSDLPLRVNGQLVGWTEFEVVGERLAVRLYGSVMKTQESLESITATGISRLSARFGISASPLRSPVPPPILLRAQRKVGDLGNRQQTKLASKEQVKPQASVPTQSLPKKLPTLKVQLNASGLLTRVVKWIRLRGLARSNDHRLQVNSTVSLGEKRFVAEIQIDGRRFLVGGGATNVVLLAQLDEKEAFEDALRKSVASVADPSGEASTERKRASA